MDSHRQKFLRLQPAAAEGYWQFWSLQRFHFERFEIEWNRIESRFFPDKEIYTALVDHTVNITTVTAAPNDSVAAVDIFSGVRGATRRNANRCPQVSLQEGDNIIALDVTAESRTA